MSRAAVQSSTIGSCLVRAWTLAMFAFAPAAANAAFFQLAENSPAGMGTAFAGGSASAHDASTVWYNPAGLTRLSGSQLVIGGHFIEPSTKFSKTSANLSPVPPLSGGAISGSNGGNAGENAWVPNLYYSQSLSNGVAVGLGVNAPFGLATDYTGDWVGRYHAKRSSIMSININPAVAYKVNDTWSIGAGVNYQKLDAWLTQAVDYGSICALAGVGACAAPGANDGQARVQAGDKAWGFNVGVLWQLGSATRVGLAYRSGIDYGLKGDFSTSAPSATAGAVGAAAPFGIVNSGVHADVKLPATLSLSAYQELGSTWAIMGDVTRTNWSRLPELRIDFDSSQPDSVVTLGLKDVYRYSVGAAYTASPTWTYRIGAAFDQSPTPSADVRTPRLPDNDRTWLTLGAGYKSSDKLTFDFSYAYLMVKDAHIEKTAGSSPSGENFLRGSLVGDYSASIHIFGAQANWKF